MFFALNCVHTLSSHTLAGNMLIIQPTSSGKSAYAKELAKLPNTLVVLACPFDKVVKQELQCPGSVALKMVNWGTLPMTLKVRLRFMVYIFILQF